MIKPIIRIETFVLFEKFIIPSFTLLDIFLIKIYTHETSPPFFNKQRRYRNHCRQNALQNA